MTYGPGRPPRLTDHQRQLIVTRYALWLFNRPCLIAAEFGITQAYVTMLGRGIKPRKAQCPPQPSVNRFTK
jgi:hypothetical protein